ncbi:hypothetical protein ACOSQ2_018078 [Xanthoceras sorbifolium]
MKLEHEDTTPVEGQDPPDENAHSMTNDCDVKTSASVDNQTPGDAIINADDNDKDMALKSEDDNDKAHESLLLIAKIWLNHRLLPKPTMVMLQLLMQLPTNFLVPKMRQPCTSPQSARM